MVGSQKAKGKFVENAVVAGVDSIIQVSLEQSESRYEVEVAEF